MIIDKIEKMQKGEIEFPNYDGFHVSGAYKCPRQLYYEAVIKKKNIFEPRVKRIFEAGNSFHRRMMRLLFKTPGVRIASTEVQIPQNDIVKGTCDCIVTVDNENVLIDFKSINKAGFGYLKDVKKEHKIQVLLYAYYFKVKKCAVIYECKDDSSLKEFIIDYNDKENQKLLNETLDKLKKIKENIKNKILPDKPVFSSDEKWKCSYCNYKGECDENRKE